MPVRTDQRYSASNPCPVCKGHPLMAKGYGRRCWGFSDGEWAICTREELAGRLSIKGNGHHHKLNGNCRCGIVHESWVFPITPPRSHSKDNSAHAKTLWEQAVDVQGTLAQRYLEARGINLPPPTCLRFHPALHHQSRRTFPAMLAAVTTWPEDKLVGIQRTWIKDDGSGKAPLEPNKMSLGLITGGAVQLSESGVVLGIAEGIETALSVQQISDIPVWAVLGSGNFQTVTLPDLPLASEVRLYADGDDAGRNAIDVAGERFNFERRRVIACPAPDGLDYNDVLRSQG